jgi:hypothetical protein
VGVLAALVFVPATSASVVSGHPEGVSIVKTGLGTVVSDPVGIVCGETCSHGFPAGTTVTVTATPAPGQTFVGWDGCEPAGQRTCSLVVTDWECIVARFTGPGSTSALGCSLDMAPPPPAAPATPPPGCTIGGTDGDDVLSGTAGNDVICALGGNDHVHGGPGNDVIRAGPGNDEIEGQRGNDRLTGGPGRDRLDGGIGADALRARDGARDLLGGGRGTDTAYADRHDRLRGIERRAT